MSFVVIVDYGTGNVHSIGRMLTSLGVRWVHTRDHAQMRSATHLLMPGVGHCAHAMRSLVETRTAEVLNDLVLRAGVPVLGICLGMQLMTLRSAEGPTDCLGWFAADTIRIAPTKTRIYKVPNIGWHAIDANSESGLFTGIDVSTLPFYFCHAYAVIAEGLVETAGTFEYEARYVAALVRDNILGVQFHPEKSQDEGMRLIANFLKMERRDV